MNEWFPFYSIFVVVFECSYMVCYCLEINYICNLLKWNGIFFLIISYNFTRFRSHKIDNNRLFVICLK